MRMKMYFSRVLITLLMFLFLAVYASADSQYTVTLDIDFKSNLIFSRYDIDVYVNDHILKSVPHGTNFTASFLAEKGSYDVFFYKSDNKKINGKFSIDVKGITQVSCAISCHRDRVAVENLSIISDDEATESPETQMPTPAPSLEINSESQQPDRSISLDDGNTASIWALSYNHLSEVSELITLHDKSGDEIRIIGHHLPAGKYRVRNHHSTPARITFYQNILNDENEKGILNPSGHNDIILFKDEEEEFTLHPNEFLRLSDGSLNLYFEMIEKN